MSVHPKDGAWVVRWRENGRQRSLSFPTEHEAEEFDRFREEEVLSRAGKMYKVYALLGPLLAKARRRQRSGASVDIRIYARRKPNGDLWGEVAFLDREGKIVTLAGEDTASNAIPLAKPEHVQRYLMHVAARLFESLEPAQTGR